MDLAEYFENTMGTGILATAAADGAVDAAVYARPHVIDDETVALIMSNRLSHANLKANPSAAYLFIEDGGGYQGIRLYLTMTGEETDPEKINEIRRKPARECPEDTEAGEKYLVYFRVDWTRPLVGDEKGDG